VPVPLPPPEIFRLEDGTEVLVRPVGPDDESLIVELHDAHSDHTIRMRFFGMVRRLTREALVRLCHLDYDCAMALAAVHSGADGRPHIIGVARYHLDPASAEAEFAVVVTDAWQGKGVGSYLMRRLAADARRRGARRLAGDVLRENTNMLQLMGGLGYAIRATDDAGVVRAVLDLAA
jgi:acetyltransferase